jgi:hypothetical protein
VDSAHSAINDQNRHWIKDKKRAWGRKPHALFSLKNGSGRFFNLAAAQATGANRDPVNARRSLGANRLKVGHPAPFGAVIGVGNVVAGSRLLFADIAGL